jgi:UDP-N-acetylglucosamine acyltransferase
VAVKSFYDDLFHGAGVFAERLELVRPRAAEDPAIAEIIGFIDEGKARGGRHRSLCMPKAGESVVE